MPKSGLPPGADLPPPVERICVMGRAHTFTADKRSDFFQTKEGPQPFLTCPACREKSNDANAKKKERLAVASEAARAEVNRLDGLLLQAEIDAEEENVLHRTEIEVVRSEALLDGERASRHALRRQVGQDSRTPSRERSLERSPTPDSISPAGAPMTTRTRPRGRSPAPMDYLDTRSQASIDSDDNHAMKRKKDAEYSARKKEEIMMYWTLFVRFLMSIFFLIVAFALIVKLSPGVLIAFLNMIGAFGEVCACTACADKNHTCDTCDRRM